MDCYFGGISPVPYLLLHSGFAYATLSLSCASLRPDIIVRDYESLAAFLHRLMRRNVVHPAVVAGEWVGGDTRRLMDLRPQLNMRR